MNFICYTCCLLAAAGGSVWIAHTASVSFAIALNVVCLVHEVGGHYLAARMLNCKATVIPFFPMWATIAPGIAERNAAEYAFFVLAGGMASALLALVLLLSYLPFGGIWETAPPLVYDIYFLSAFLTVVNLVFPLGNWDGGRLFLLCVGRSTAVAALGYAVLLVVGCILLLALEGIWITFAFVTLALLCGPGIVRFTADRARDLSLYGGVVLLAIWSGTVALSTLSLAAVPQHREMLGPLFNRITERVLSLIT